MTHATQCSRRHFITTAAVAAGSALAPRFSLASPLQDPVIDTTEKQGKPVSHEKVSWKARPFPLKQVRLGEGPCKVAMEADRRYLHSLPTDRLLHTFRINAGIPSSAQPLGGWEAPDCELRGHYSFHGAGQSQDLTLVPLYQLIHERYAIYWKVNGQST